MISSSNSLLRFTHTFEEVVELEFPPGFAKPRHVNVQEWGVLAHRL